jgi:hypothetical protein
MHGRHSESMKRNECKHKYSPIYSSPITREPKSQMWLNAEEWKPVRKWFYQQIAKSIHCLDNQFDNGHRLETHVGCET